MRKWWLALILILGFLLRVLWLDKFPVGFTPDEASFGYDAYSILKTGRDQWGKPFPLVLESFGDFKSPLYAYLAVPSVAAFGLNKFAVRLPNAVLGSMAVMVVWLLVKKLTKKGKIANIAALLLAISPWHVMLSRGAFEANLTTFFLPLGIYLFLTKRFFWSGVILGLNLFTYHSAKLITPLVFIAFIIYSKEKLKNFYPALLSFALFLGLTFYTFTIGAGARISERSITSGALEAGARVKIELIQKGMNPILARLLHNKYQVVAERFIRNYIQYFSLRFLIFDGPAETTYGMVRNLGVLTYVEIAGVVSLFVLLKKFKDEAPASLRSGYLLRSLRRERNPAEAENSSPSSLRLRSGFSAKADKKLLLFLLFWLLVAVVPSALSTGVGYAANRAAGMMPTIQILAGIGLAILIERYKKTHLISVIIIVGLGVFLYKYIVLSPTQSAKGMLAGNLELAAEMVTASEKYDQIVISKTLSEPHIYIAFAARYDPRRYQEETKNWKYKEAGVSWVDQMPEYSLGKFTFK